MKRTSAQIRRANQLQNQRYPWLERYKKAKRRARYYGRQVEWADKKAIQAVYAEAHRRSKETGVLYVVDHCIPFNGELASGLHVHWNMQIITKEENDIKNDHFDPAEWTF